LKQCRLPLTGKGVVDVIITELAVFHVTDRGLVLIYLQPGVDVKTVTEKTEANFYYDSVRFK
jgi:acetate CoA/acetoacetate CoA-transferase beta subunit